MILHKIESSKPAFGGTPTLRVVLNGQQQGVPPLIAAQAKEGDYLAVLTPEDVANWSRVLPESVVKGTASGTVTRLY